MDKSVLLDWYHTMVLIRRFEERCDHLYKFEGSIKGFLHLYIGQEAVAVGTIAAREEGDHVITAYRDHGHALAVGCHPNHVMAELMGKATGVSGGRGGSMHMADITKTFWGGYGIVGGQTPLGTGFALAEKYKGTDRATLCYMGEGSTNIGYFHESLNMAGVWDLPIIYVIENNKYGMGTEVSKASAEPIMIEKVKAYRIPGERVDGMDVFAVYEATKQALARVRAGEGPQCLEMMTYRYEGHSVGDRTRYRTKEELALWRDEKDPIRTLQLECTERYGIAESEMLAIQEQVMEEVEESVRFANESPYPDPSTLYDYIYPVQEEPLTLD